MKTVIRILNFVILAISAAATICLFAVPPMTFNSKVSVNVDAFSKFVPETEYSKDIDIVKLIGTKNIDVAIKFKMNSSEMAQFMNGDREAINSTLINQNIKGITNTLREPVDLITDFTIRSVIKSTVQDEVTKRIEEGVKDASLGDTTAADIMSEIGMNDGYFSRFAISLYNAANAEGATIDTVGDVLLDYVNQAVTTTIECQPMLKDYLHPLEDKDVVDIKTNLVGILSNLKLVKEDNLHLKPISKICYIYLSDYLVEGLTGKVDAATLAPKAEEVDNYEAYSDRLLGIYVAQMLPQEFYSTIGYVSLGLFIGLFVFAAIWIILFIITLIKTFTPKPWTIFGPWFWIIGALLPILGLGLTIAGKVIIPGIKFNIANFPISHIILAPRTYALVPSILFLIMIPLAIVYAVFRHNLKKEMKGKVVVKL